MEFSPKFNVPDQQEVERERGVISYQSNDSGKSPK